jgi:hypothetical protein
LQSISSACCKVGGGASRIEVGVVLENNRYRRMSGRRLVDSKSWLL